MRETRGLRELAQEALGIQNACNSCGLASGMHRALCDLMKHAQTRGLGTDWVNDHHVTRLWIDKLASLAGVTTSVSMQSYHWCQELVEGRNPAGALDEVADALTTEGACR